MSFKLAGRVPGIVARDPGALERRFADAAGAEPGTAVGAGRAAMKRRSTWPARWNWMVQRC